MRRICCSRIVYRPAAAADTDDRALRLRSGRRAADRTTVISAEMSGTTISDHAGAVGGTAAKSAPTCGTTSSRPVRFNIGGRRASSAAGRSVFSPRLAALYKVLPSFPACRSTALPVAVGDQQLPAGECHFADRPERSRRCCRRRCGRPSPPFPLVVGHRQRDLRSAAHANKLSRNLTAYKVAYTGTFKDRTTVGVAFYVNDLDAASTVQLPSNLDPHRRIRRRAGLRRRSGRDGAAESTCRGRHLLNLGPLRQRPRVSLDQRISRELTAFVNFVAGPRYLDDRSIPDQERRFRRPTASTPASIATAPACSAAGR